MPINVHRSKVHPFDARNFLMKEVTIFIEFLSIVWIYISLLHGKLMIESL